MDTFINPAQFFTVYERPQSRPTAIAQVDLLRNGDALETINRIRDTFGILFEFDFWERLGISLRRQSRADLTPLRVNPRLVLATQPYVSAGEVIEMLQLPPAQFGRLVTGVHDPAQPIILLQTPHGFITVNGHHRLRVLQLLKVRVARVHAVRRTPAVVEQVSRLFYQYGYLDIGEKRVYS